MDYYSINPLQFSPTKKYLSPLYQSQPILFVRKLVNYHGLYITEGETETWRSAMLRLGDTQQAGQNHSLGPHL